MRLKFDVQMCFFGCGCIRVPEQSELKHMCSEYERPDLRANIGIRAWCPQGDGENCKADQKSGSLSIQGETGMQS